MGMRGPAAQPRPAAAHPGWALLGNGTGTHLAWMLLGCPAVRVRRATRPHPFKASPGMGPR